MGYELRRPIPDTTFKVHRDPYFGDPSPELDQRWTYRLRCITAHSHAKPRHIRTDPYL